MDTSVFLALALACAPQVHTDTAHALVSVESAFNPWAIGVVGGALVRQPRHRAEAVEAQMHVGRALAMSGDSADRDLARSIATFVQEMAPTSPTTTPRTQTQQTPAPRPVDIEPHR